MCGKKEVDQVPETVSYLPVWHYKGSRSNIVTGMISAATEIVMNSFGEKEVIKLEKSNGHHHLDGRGDTQHRSGGIRTIEEHDLLVQQSDLNRKKNLLNRQKKKS